MKYAIEIEKTLSINKAAENLFMGQPNLSRAIKELEQSFGITIFKRTPKGIEPTAQGKEFLGFAKGIINQIAEVENFYSKDNKATQTFSISVPRASYITNAFTEFVKRLKLSELVDINYKETNNMRAIKNIVEEGYSLGIIRYISSYKRYFDIFLKERNLQSKPICKFKYVVIMSSKHPLANEQLTSDNLSQYIQISYGDPFIPSLSVADVKRIEFCEKINKHIYVYERGSQFDLLSEVPTTFMRVSPIPQKLLDRYGLVQKNSLCFDKDYEDILIFKDNHHFTDLENDFIDELNKSVQENILSYNY